MYRKPQKSACGYYTKYAAIERLVDADLRAPGGFVRHLFGAGTCMYCCVLFGTCGLSATALLCRQTATQASFITQHVALTDDCDATGLLPTAATRIAAFYHTRAHARRTHRVVHFAEQSPD